MPSTSISGYVPGYPAGYVVQFGTFRSCKANPSVSITLAPNLSSSSAAAAKKNGLYLRLGLRNSAGVQVGVVEIPYTGGSVSRTFSGVPKGSYAFNARLVNAMGAGYTFGGTFYH